MELIRGAPSHPRLTQGKIERRHQTMKNRKLLENPFFQNKLEAAIGDFVGYYNHRRNHESLKNLLQPMPTPGAAGRFYSSARQSKEEYSKGRVCSMLNLRPRF